MTLLLTYWKPLAALILLCGAFWLGREWRDRSCDVAATKAEKVQALADRDAAQRAVLDEQATREAEHARAQAQEQIAAAYEQGKQDAQAKADAVAAGLTAGNLKLRHELGALYTAQLSSAAAGTVQLDAAAQRGADIAAAAIGVGAKCDAQAAGLQAVVRADRK